jgi:SAM-dependent methyltransferase
MREMGTTCSLCAAPARFFTHKNGFDIYSCTGCGLAFVHPVPDPARVYTRDYFAGATLGFGYVNYDYDKAPMAPALRGYLRAIAPLAPRHATLLDVGAATGVFISLAQQHGFDARGVELSEYAAQEARRKGLAVATGTLADLSASERFDVITMLDVIEHMPDPRREIGLARERLQDGGVLAISTLDGGSLYARLMGRRWNQIVPPEHLYYFNRAALRLLLDEAGFDVTGISAVGKRFRLPYIFKTLYAWQRIALWERLLQWSSQGAPSRLAVPINLRDNMFVIARKR